MQKLFLSSSYNGKIDATLSSQYAPVPSFNDEEAMHVVYAACGAKVREQLVVSLRSLYVSALSSLVRAPFFYHVHVITDGSEGSVTAEELGFLQPQSHFKLSLHAPFPEAVFGFRKCATQRIYLHSHADFRSLDKVRRGCMRVNSKVP